MKNAILISAITAFALSANSTLQSQISDDSVFKPKNAGELSEINENLRRIIKSHLNKHGIVSTSEKEIYIKHNSPLALIEDDKDSDAMKAIAVKVAPLIINEMGMIRNQAMPMVKEVSEKINELLNEEDSKFNLLGDRKIVTVTDSLLVDRLERENRISIVENIGRNNIVIEMNDRSGSEIRDMLKETFSDYRKVTTELESFTDEELASIFTKYFSYMNTNSAKFKELITGGSATFNTSVVLYMITEALYNNPDDSVKLSLEMYNTALIYLKKMLGNILLNNNKIIKHQIKSGYVGIKKLDNTIYVIESNYLDFLKDNPIEVVLGYYLENSGPAKKDDLVKEAGILKTKWNNFSTLEQDKFNRGRLNRISFAIRKTVYDLSLELKDREIETIDDLVKTVDEEYTKKLTLNNLDISKISEDIVLDYVFGKTNAREFIEYMKYFKDMNENLEINQTANFAAMSLLLDWIVEQVEIKG